MALVGDTGCPKCKGKSFTFKDGVLICNRCGAVAWSGEEDKNSK